MTFSIRKDPMEHHHAPLRIRYVPFRTRTATSHAASRRSGHITACGT
jgi:hypothetical protein